MRTKPMDEPYCGCNKEAILSYNGKIDMDNMKVLYEYVCERNKAYIKKSLGEPFPWTDNEIIKTYSFTNLKREQDKTSKWLINNISKNDYMNKSDRFYNSMIFRMYNRIDVAEILELYKPVDENNYEKMIKKLDNMKNCYTRAFKTIGLRNGIRNMLGINNERALPLLYIKYLKEINNGNIPSELEYSRNQKDAYKWFLGIDGVGQFMAYQFFVDMTYMDWFNFSENEFVVCGPGALKGLSYLFPEDCCLTPSEKIFWLRNNIDRLFSEIDSKYNVFDFFKSCWCKDEDCCWNVMSLENVMCELSKYMWLYKGIGSPKRKYKPNDGCLFQD